MEKIIKETLINLLENMDLSYDKISVEKRSETEYKVNLESEEYSPLLIGWHGETINAMQHIFKVLLWKKSKGSLPENFTINLDVDDYKARQEDAALSIAQRKVDEAITSQSSVELPTMNAYLRKQIHMYIAELQNENVTTESVGEGEERRIKLIYKA